MKVRFVIAAGVILMLLVVASSLGLWVVVAIAAPAALLVHHRARHGLRKAVDAKSHALRELAFDVLAAIEDAGDAHAEADEARYTSELRSLTPGFGGHEVRMHVLAMRAMTVSLAALIMSVASCGEDHECPPGPSPAPAVEIRVSAEGSAGPVTGAFVVVSRSSQPQPGHSTEPCNAEVDASVCRVQGEPGTYNLEVGAPGFSTQQFTVSVQGSSGECGYTIFMTQRLSVVLQRASSTGQ